MARNSYWTGLWQNDTPPGPDNSWRGMPPETCQRRKMQCRVCHTKAATVFCTTKNLPLCSSCDAALHEDNVNLWHARVPANECFLQLQLPRRPPATSSGGAVSLFNSNGRTAGSAFEGSHPSAPDSVLLCSCRAVSPVQRVTLAMAPRRLAGRASNTASTCPVPAPVQVCQEPSSTTGCPCCACAGVLDAFSSRLLPKLAASLVLEEPADMFEVPDVAAAWLPEAARAWPKPAGTSKQVRLERSACSGSRYPVPRTKCFSPRMYAGRGHCGRRAEPPVREAGSSQRQQSGCSGPWCIFWAPCRCEDG